MRYQEEQKSLPIIIITLAVVAVLVLPFSIYKTLMVSTTPLWVPILLIVVEGVLIFVFGNFYKLRIKVDEEYLEFGFGLIKKRFKRQDIISCEPYQLRFGNYLGMGIRFGFDKTIAFNTRFGRGVKIRIEGKKRAYVLTTNNPQALCGALRR